MSETQTVDYETMMRSAQVEIMPAHMDALPARRADPSDGAGPPADE